MASVNGTSAAAAQQTTDYKKVAIKRYPQLRQRATAETRYWRKFNFPITVKGHAAVTAINFCPAKPYDFAVSSSTRVQIFAANTNKVKKTIARFKDVAYSGHIREDGQLMVAGDESGLVQIFNLNSREILRSYTDHLRPVHLTKFASFTSVMTGSDDTTVRCIDVPSQAMTVKMTGHTDYVRTGVVNAANPDMWLTGSYDHTVKLWDIRSAECTMTMDHGAPVESVLMYPSGGVALSAGGNYIKVWDVLGGGRLLHSFSNHQKAITCLSFDGENKRLLSGSLDHHVKIYNVSNYKVVHGIKYSAPILSLAMAPQDTHLVVGMANGTLSIRYKPTQAANAALTFKSADAAPRGGTYKYFVRGKSAKPSGEDFRVEVQRKKRLRPYDVFLKKFQYGAALDAALATKRPVIIVSLIEELRHRGGLKIALSGRDEATLEPLLTFLIKNAINPRYATVLLDVCSLVFDIYGPVLGQSMQIDELVIKLHRKVAQELEFQKRMFELLGTLDIVLSSATA